MWVRFWVWSIHPEAKFLSIFGPMKFRNKLSVYKSNGETCIDRTDIHILKGGKLEGIKGNMSQTSLKISRGNSIRFQALRIILFGSQGVAPCSGNGSSPPTSTLWDGTALSTVKVLVAPCLCIWKQLEPCSWDLQRQTGLNPLNLLFYYRVLEVW